MASLTAWHIEDTKRSPFLRAFIGYVTEEEYCFDCSGSQASHQAFKEKHGDTAKHFVRIFLQGEAISTEFAPAGK